MVTKRENLYNTIGYYCWLIPSCISFLLSLYLIFILLYKKKTIFNTLEFLYCLGDLLQCIAWFIGPLYTLNDNNNSNSNFSNSSSHSNLCLTQEFLFEIGLFIKTSIAVLVSGLFASYTTSRENFKMSKIRLFFFLIIFYTILSIILSYIFKSNKAGCEGILEHSFSSINRYELAYFLTFVLPVSLYMILIVIFSSIGLYYRKEDISSALLTPIFDGLKMCFVIVNLAIIPCFIFYFMISYGRMNIVLYCITGIIISSTGTLFSCYHIYSPYLNKTHRFNLFFFLDIIADNLSQSDQILSSNMLDNSTASHAFSRSPSSTFELNDPHHPHGHRGRITSHCTANTISS